MQSEIDGLKMQRAWKWTNGCKDVNSKTERGFCQKLTGLDAELASASAAKTADVRISELRSKIDAAAGKPALSEADPQAKVLTELASAFFPSVKIENVQMALTLFVALLLEIGSGFGMYVAFSQWRLYDRQSAAPKLARAEEHRCGSGGGSGCSHRLPLRQASRVGANDNRSIEIPLEREVVQVPAIEARPAEVHQVGRRLSKESRSSGCAYRS